MVARVEREWAGAVGPELARRAFPLDLDHGILAVGAETSACLQELTLRAPDIVSALGRRLGSAVTAIRPCLRRRPTEPRAPATPGWPPPSAALTPAETESVARLVAAIADPDVAAAARRVLVKDHLARREHLVRPHSAEPPMSPALSAPEPVSESPRRGGPNRHRVLPTSTEVSPKGSPDDQELGSGPPGAPALPGRLCRTRRDHVTAPDLGGAGAPRPGSGPQRAAQRPG